MKKNGMLIALMNEYRKSAIEYKHILNNISQSLFVKITDDKTKDEDCKSIQNITFHIIQSGYTYSNYINSVNKREWYEYKEEIITPEKGIKEIDKMLDFTENSFDGIWDKSNEEIEKWKFDTRWNVTYDFEQLMEHAIVHILRHRRQIENVIKNNG